VEGQRVMQVLDETLNATRLMSADSVRLAGQTA
jgi:hypothetical protein